MIDKRTRFPVVEQTTSTSCKVTCDRLRKIFATHGIPKKVESDNGPPFSSTDFKGFAEEMGFEHHRVTPEHPRANGEAESFMKVLNKTEQIAHSDGTPSSSAIQHMLMGYRSTPHPATGYSPYEALMRRNVRTKLDYEETGVNKDYHRMEKEITKRDRQYKKKWDKQNRHPKCEEHNFKVGDKVLLKKRKENKWSTAHEKEYYEIIKIYGSTIIARRKSDGRSIRRDSSKFKLLRESRDERWRERILRKPNHNQQDQPNRTEVGTNHMERDDIQDDTTLEVTDQEQPQPQRRELPRRTRRLPSKFKDYILDFKKKR